MKFSDELVKEVEEYVSSLFFHQLPKELCYHDINHTQCVVGAVELIGRHENLTASERELVVLAAWFHDTGFIETYCGHELLSQRLATDFLTRINYPNNKIQVIRNCIASTMLPQQPNNLLEEILCDADLIHLSQNDYWDKNALFKRELCLKFNKQFSDDIWLTDNLNFLKSHSYFTSYGRNVLESSKEKNLRLNLEMCSDFALF